jgi:hypothetical protein
MQFLKCTVAVLLAAPIFGSGGNFETGVTVHEWGTFTTIADGSGGSEPWSPLGDAGDLPCFVNRLNGMAIKFMPQGPLPPITQTVTVRMETPVLYFYSAQKAMLSVRVNFPKGLISEWYPDSSEIGPGPRATLPPVKDGRIAWNSIQILPEHEGAMTQAGGASHYFAARHTDSNLVRIGQQQEKFLFYRGVAQFSVPLSARLTNANSVELRNSGDDPLALAVLFENRGGKIGYRVLRGLQGASEVQAPALTGNLDRLKRELADGLVSQGLYRKEAEAMVETWRDSWFEEGMRVFYLVPQALVNRELPLAIQPAPAKIARVFVGREEILSPYLRDRLMTALAAGDTQDLDRFGRFLAPFMRQVKTNMAPSVAPYLAAKSEAATNEYYQPSCVR